MHKYLFSLLLILLTVCSCQSSQDYAQIDAWNQRSYATRYMDVDTSLYYANKALSASSDYPQGRSEAYNNIAFVAYQQMRYDKSLHLLQHIYHESGNQIELLCADVMKMKVSQRTGMGHVFFRARNSALRRLSRIDEETSSLTPAQLARVEYARTELYIVCSTYYYYLGLDSAAIDAIQSISDKVVLSVDTAQWLNYHYMLGSGGLVTGDSTQVLLTEFDHLFRTYTLARATSHRYFEANALQSLATMFSHPGTDSLVLAQRPDAYHYLHAQHIQDPEAASTSFSLSLANHALALFRQYKDLFQTACVYRTLGEIYFSQGNYTAAHHHFALAYRLVDEQHARCSLSVMPWMAGISEKLSMSYSALGNKKASDHYRNEYLDLLDKSRQNREYESRMEDLSQEVHSIRIRLYILFILIAFILCGAVYLIRRMKHRSSLHSDNILNIHAPPLYHDVMQQFQRLHDTCQQAQEEQQEQIDCSRLQLDGYKSGNIVRRSKVSLVYAIIPYINRIVAEVNRIQPDGRLTPQQLDYIGELTDEIMRLNDVLTEWIQMKQGQLKLHVTTFPLQQLFDIVGRNAVSFGKLGIDLRMPHTPLQVKADYVLTLFMVNTLLDNARKFTPTGGHVAVDVQEGSDYVEIGISDTGIGLSVQDVDTLNNSKVYNASQLGTADSRKGFGFGIMNCKGIIGKYHKVSQLFHVCDFGVQSQIGQGSRFWFRLPRVLSLLLGLFFAGQSFGQTSYELYDSLFNANLQRQHQDALTYGHRAIQAMEEPVDTPLLVSIHNEIAIAALALNRWDIYQSHNSQCVRLHRLYTQDDTLESYCTRMERLQSDGLYLYAMLILLSLIAAILFYFVFLRDRLRNQRFLTALYAQMQSYLQESLAYAHRLAASDQQPIHELLSSTPSLSDQLQDKRQQMLHATASYPAIQPAILNVCNTLSEQDQLLRQSDEHLQQLRETYDRLSFEEDNLYVSNQILDNALSTIKHETMYFPARIQQMVRLMQQTTFDAEDCQELHELVSYYNDIYNLLYTQAEHQLDRNYFHRTSIPLSTLTTYFTQSLPPTSLITNPSSSPVPIGFPMDSPSAPCAVLGDLHLLQIFFQTLIHQCAPTSQGLRLELEPTGRFVTFHIIVATGSPSSWSGAEAQSELTDLFTPSTAHIPYLIMRQIIREHDAYSGHPGLRLLALPHPDGFEIQFTLLQSNA